MPDTPWGKPLRDTTLEDLRTFFAEAGDEGVTWEAKGTELISKREIRKHVCGFANTLGGFLILGAAETSTGWLLSGLCFPEREAAKWLEAVCRSGLSPAPELAAAEFSIDADSKVVVLEVWPSSVPPVLIEGRAYERVSGATIPVTDPSILGELIRRGRSQLVAMRESAENAAREVSRAIDGSDSASVPALPRERVAVALAPLGVPDRLRELMHTSKLFGLIKELLRGETYPHFQAFRAHGLDWAEFRTRLDHGDEDFLALRVHVDGTIVCAFDKEGIYTVRDAEWLISTAWTWGSHLATALGVRGPGWVCLAVGADQQHDLRFLNTIEPIAWQRGALSTPPDRDEVSRVHRMLLRAAGKVAYED